MSNELYYRGSSSYEVAVKNRLSDLERSGIRNTVALMNSMQNMEYGIRSDIRKSTYAVVASQEMLGEMYKHGFNSINNSLDIGFSVLASGMKSLSADINSLGKNMFAVSEVICNKLDALHDIMNNPLLTASRELYRRALTNFEKGYFEEALEDCKAAVEKNKTDFVSWYLLGQIYLFGAGKFSNVINPALAENAFFNAAKYIDADLGTKEADEFASQIYYYLGYSRLILSNDLLIENKADESVKKLEDAEKASQESYRLSKTNLVAAYEQAKELHFLGKDTECLSLLEELIKKEKTFALKATCDKNFESIWGQIEDVIKKLKDEKCKQILKSVSDAITPFEKEIKSNSEVRNRLNLSGKCCGDIVQRKIDAFKKKFSSVKKRDFFSVLSTLEQLPKDIRAFKRDVESDIDSAKTDIADEKAEIERQEELKREQEERQRALIEQQEKERREQDEKRLAIIKQTYENEVIIKDFSKILDVLEEYIKANKEVCEDAYYNKNNKEICINSCCVGDNVFFYQRERKIGRGEFESYMTVDEVSDIFVDFVNSNGLFSIYSIYREIWKKNGDRRIYIDGANYNDDPFGQLCRKYALLCKKANSIRIRRNWILTIPAAIVSAFVTGYFYFNAGHEVLGILVAICMGGSIGISKCIDKKYGNGQKFIFLLSPMIFGIALFLLGYSILCILSFLVSAIISACFIEFKKETGAPFVYYMVSNIISIAITFILGGIFFRLGHPIIGFLGAIFIFITYCLISIIASCAYFPNKNGYIEEVMQGANRKRLIVSPIIIGLSVLVAVVTLCNHYIIGFIFILFSFIALLISIEKNPITGIPHYRE